MSENQRSQIDILNSLGLIDRLRLRLRNGLQICDSENFPKLEKAVEMNGFGFIRAELPLKYRFVNPEINKEYPNSRMIMLRISKEDQKYKLVRVPGMHVVTGVNDDLTRDPYANFKHILNYQFHGGPTVNSYLLDEDYFDCLKRYGYNGNK